MSHFGRNPILSADGQFYCSPECGGGKFCRKEWYDHAVAAGDALAAQLGEGWEPRVWENLGWFYDVRKGCVTVSAHDTRGRYPTTYSAWIEPNVALNKHTALQIIAQGATPEDALGNAVQDARTIMARMVEALAVLNDTADSLSAVPA